MRLLRQYAAATAIALLACVAQAEPLQLILQRAQLAGFSYHAAAAQWEQLRQGDTLRLVREPDNPHDPLAVHVYWSDQSIGYLPRSGNGAVARALDRGQPLLAMISRLREHPDPRKRIEVEVRTSLSATH